MNETSAPQSPERAGRNQARFREYNERMEPHNAVHLWVDPPYADWMCECADVECRRPVQLTVAEYEAVRRDSTRFVVAPSDEHVLPEVERVIERNERYWVVEKLGEAADVTDALDQRARDAASQESEVTLHADRVAWSVPEAKRR